MKRITFRSLIAAAAMLIGASSYAQTVLYERGTSETTAWTADNISDFTTSGTIVSYGLSDYGAQLESSNQTVAAEKTISPAEDAIINVEAVWLGMSNTGRYLSVTTASYFRFGNIYIMENDQDQKSCYSLNGLAYNENNLFTIPGYRTYDPSTRAFYLIQLEINTASNTLNYLRIYNANSSSTPVVEVTNVVLSNPNYTKIGFGYNKGGGVGTTQNEFLKSIKVTQTVKTVNKVNYTILFRNEDGEEIKEDIVRSGVVGEAFSATEDDMATFFSDDASMKYIYASGNESKTATENAEDNVITLVFDEYEKVAYTITAKSGETTLGEISSGDAYTDGSTTAYWHKYMQVDGKWYEATTSTFGNTITAAGNTDIAYTESDITYFVEAENISKSRSAAANAIGERYSGGEAQRHYASTQCWTAPFAEGGDYILTFPYSMANASASTLVIKTRNEDGTFTETGKSLTANTPGTFSETITVPAGSSIAICNDAAYNSNILIDYVAVKRVAPETIEVTMASCGYATLCSEYALDFSENEDVKAYIATELKDGKVLTEQIQMAAAGEGIILKSSSASVTVATTTESVEKNENNKMVGDPKNAINLTANQGYILSANDGLFHPCSEGTLAAGKAYLAIDVVAADGAKVLTLDFAEEGMATAINEVETTTTSDAVFTLGGTRMIGEPTQRGIYIVGGKKVVIK